MTATGHGNFTRRLTLLVESGVVCTVGMLEGMLRGMRDIPDATY